ncbi:MAG: phytanoyl-CoA dioxygenase family protein [Pseudonocardia sediminis]
MRTSPPNPYLSDATGAGPAEDVGTAWDGDNEGWWDWYMSLADSGPDTSPLVEPEAHDPGPLPTDDEVAAELGRAYPVTDEMIDAFAQDGFVRLPGVISPGAAEVLRRRLAHLLGEGGEGEGLRSREMMWREDPLVRAAVLSPRVGGICSDLLGARDLRLYHDSALCKEPGTGRTPWHYDAHHFPLDSNDVISTWMPLQPVPSAMGPLTFARGMQAYKLVSDVAFDKHGTSYDRRVAETFRDAGVEVVEEPFAAGDVSFHSTLCFHTAGANRTTRQRMVLGSTYYADGASIIDHPTMVSGDWRLFVPDTSPGERAASENNPVLAPPV